MKRCSWCNLKNELYIKYHDEEWGVLNKDESYLYEMFILETFVAGLSFEIVLNKREYFRSVLDNFDINKIINYKEEKINELLYDKLMIKNKLKIKAMISNSIIYKEITKEFGSFFNYLKIFWDSNIIYKVNGVKNELSDLIANDLKKRGMKFCGSITIYSYLESVGIINGHSKECFKYYLK